jgi:hypothetical protein
MIPDVAIEVNIASEKLQRIFGEEPCSLRVVVSGAVIIRSSTSLIADLAQLGFTPL